MTNQNIKNNAHSNVFVLSMTIDFIFRFAKSIKNNLYNIQFGGCLDEL